MIIMSSNNNLVANDVFYTLKNNLGVVLKRGDKKVIIINKGDSWRVLYISGGEIWVDGVLDINSTIVDGFIEHGFVLDKVISTSQM